MKITKLALSLFVGLATIAVSAQTITGMDSKAYPILTFKNAIHDFGTIDEGETVETVYKFTNTGKAPLLITKIKAACGCTVPSGWSKAPILPGQSGQFTVKFNSNGKPNGQHKSISIYCNTKKARERVSFKAHVVPNPKLAEQREEQKRIRKEQYLKKQDAKNTKDAETKKASLKLLKERQDRDSKQTENQEFILDKQSKELRELKEKAKEEKRVQEKKENQLREALTKERKEDKLRAEAKKERKEIERNNDRIKKEQRKTAKKVKQEQKELKREAKKAKKLAKLERKIAKTSRKVASQEKGLQRLKDKFTKQETKGDLSPNEVIKFKSKITKHTEKLEKRKSKLLKLERKR